MKNIIDINADVGERPEALADGSEEQLISQITSANIACGGHAGNEEMMGVVVRLCLKHRVSVGAHPGYPDRENFGRAEMPIEHSALGASLVEQILALRSIAQNLGATITHIKPHGALYNVAVRDPATAEVIGKAVLDVDKSLILIGLADSGALWVWDKMGLTTRGEAFADRLYEADGTLRSRKHPDALITDAAEAAAQALLIAQEGFVVARGGKRVSVAAQTICIHGDTPNSLEIAKAVKERLQGAGLIL